MFTNNRRGSMAKIPAPKAAPGGCVEIGGIIVCPHVVHLTGAQLKQVKTMHARNVERAKKAAKKAPKK